MPKQTWSTVKSAVAQLSNRELLSLIGDLYRFSKQNQAFLHARYADVEAAMEDCKKIIAECLYPDVLRDRPLQVAKAKKAVADFCKAVAEPVFHAELMVFFLEQGNPREMQEPYRERLAEVVRSSSRIGWGYHDELADIYRTTFLDGN